MTLDVFRKYGSKEGVFNCSIQNGIQDVYSIALLSKKHRRLQEDPLLDFIFQTKLYFAASQEQIGDITHARKQLQDYLSSKKCGDKGDSALKYFKKLYSDKQKSRIKIKEVLKSIKKKIDELDKELEKHGIEIDKLQEDLSNIKSYKDLPKNYKTQSLKLSNSKEVHTEALVEIRLLASKCSTIKHVKLLLEGLDKNINHLSNPMNRLEVRTKIQEEVKTIPQMKVCIKKLQKALIVDLAHCIPLLSEIQKINQLVDSYLTLSLKCSSKRIDEKKWNALKCGDQPKHQKTKAVFKKEYVAKQEEKMAVMALKMTRLALEGIGKRQSWIKKYTYLERAHGVTRIFFTAMLCFSIGRFSVLKKMEKKLGFLSIGSAVFYLTTLSSLLLYRSHYYTQQKGIVESINKLYEKLRVHPENEVFKYLKGYLPLGRKCAMLKS